MENISALMRQTKFYRQLSNTSSDAINESYEKDFSLDFDDLKEDEGFVLVGQTPSERSSADSLSCKMSSNDPSLPSYSQVTALQRSFHENPSSPIKFNTAPKPTSAISDVPFKFHPSLDTDMQIKEMFHGIDLETRQFNWGKYSHDFSNEKLCLRDLSCGEEANIDEFVLSNSQATKFSTTFGDLIEL